jgi:hypothetical protein
MLKFLCQKNIQLAGKTFTLVKHSIQRAKRHSRRSNPDLTETPPRVLVTLVKNIVKFPFALFGFLVGFSEKRATSQKNVHLFKMAFNSCSGCQTRKLSTRRFSRVSFIPERRDGLGRF